MPALPTPNRIAARLQPCFPRARVLAYLALGALLLDQWLNSGTLGLLAPGQ